MMLQKLKKMFTLAKIEDNSSAAGIPTVKGLPDWKAFLDAHMDQWQAALSRRRSPRILIATNVGGHGPVSIMESMLAVAFTMRGAEVHTLLCDGVLPGCLRAEHSDIPDASVIADYRLPAVLCPGCMAKGKKIFEALGLDHHRLGTLVTETERAAARKLAGDVSFEDISAFKHLDVNVGEQAYAGALRYFARGDLSAEAHGEAVLRRYLEASILSMNAIERLVTTQDFDVACFHHGLYVPQGVVGEVCRKHSIRVVNWFVTYRRNTFIFSHDDTYHHTLLSEPASAWDEMTWSDKQESQIVDYLKSRWYGNRDWISFHEKPDEDFERYAKSRGLDLNKPIIGMLTNVMWDAQLHYRQNAFRNMLDWVLQTIAYFSKRQDVQLVMRIHPAEIRGTARSRQPLLDEIIRAYPQLPPNVFIVPPESPVSTYAAMEHCDSVLIYGTKTGVELTAMGIPVIVAGEAWIKNKGLTLDASSPEEYFKLLEQLPIGRRNDATLTQRARKYAFHFFFRRMIPLPFMRANNQATLFDIEISSLDDFQPGKWPGLDIVCDGVLNGKPFIFPAETYGVHDL
jgi:hypothetical protein